MPILSDCWKDQRSVGAGHRELGHLPSQVWTPQRSANCHSFTPAHSSWLWGAGPHAHEKSLFRCCHHGLRNDGSHLSSAFQTHSKAPHRQNQNHLQNPANLGRSPTGPTSLTCHRPHATSHTHWNFQMATAMTPSFCNHPSFKWEGTQLLTKVGDPKSHQLLSPSSGTHCSSSSVANPPRYQLTWPIDKFHQNQITLCNRRN